MANTPRGTFRIPPELITAARERTGAHDVPLSVLARAGLAVLAGANPTDALAEAQMQARPGAKDERPGPKTPEGIAARSAALAAGRTGRKSPAESAA